MAGSLIVTREDGGVAVVTLDHQERLNSLTTEMLQQLEDAARELGRDADIRVVIITGAGRGFCSGLDLDILAGLPGNTMPEQLDLQEFAARAFLAVRELRVPVIAAVNGAAVGAGMALALAADIRLGSPDASFVAGFTRIGLSAGDLGVSWLLPRVIGPGPAAELVFTGGALDAADAAQLRLLNRIVAEGTVLDAARELAGRIAQNSPSGVRLSKSALRANQEIGSYAAALELENRGQVLATRTEDMVEAIGAFRDKRRPEFRNR